MYIPYLSSLPICPTSSTTVSILSTWMAATAFYRPSAVFSVRPRLPSLLPTRFRKIRRRFPPVPSDAPQKSIRNRSNRLEIAINCGNRLLSRHATCRVCRHGTSHHKYEKHTVLTSTSCVIARFFFVPESLHIFHLHVTSPITVLRLNNF